MKQRHTSKRMFERLRDERGYVAGVTMVKDDVLGLSRTRWRERGGHSRTCLVTHP